MSNDAAFENAVSATRWADCTLHMTPFQFIYYSTGLWMQFYSSINSQPRAMQVTKKKKAKEKQRMESEQAHSSQAGAMYTETWTVAFTV